MKPCVASPFAICRLRRHRASPVCAPNLTFVFLYLVGHSAHSSRTAGHYCCLAKACNFLLLHLPLKNCDCFGCAEALKALRAPSVLMLKSEATLDFANGLSLELWAQIMSLLMSGVPKGKLMRCSSPERMFSQQASFHRLRLVCKRFNEVFLKYPDLCRDLVFRQQQADTLSPSLVAWLKRYHTSVRLLAAYCGNSALVQLLEMLSSSKNNLQSVLVQNYLCGALPSFSAFDHLTVLEVVAPGDGPVDLSTLQLSKSLQALVMQDGTFETKSLPPNLTYLFLTRSKLTSYKTCSCVTSLIRLNLVDSSLLGLHSQGLLACHALDRLTCLESCISATDMQQFLMFNQTSFILPLGLSALTSLRCFDARIASISTVTLDAFYELTSLQDLTVCVHGASLSANNGLSRLSMLTSLRLLARPANPGVGVQLFTGWLGMQALQVLYISCDWFSFGRDIVGLVKLDSLRLVNIRSARPYDHKSFAFFAALAHGIAKHPCAQLYLNDVPVEQVLADGLQYCISGFDVTS